MSKATRQTSRSAKPSSKGKPKPKPKAKGGRPPKWTLERRREIVRLVCDTIAGCGTLLDVCPRIVGEDSDVPTASVFLTWLHDDQPEGEEFARLYARAREDRLDTLEEQLLRTSFDGRNDLTRDSNGNIVVNSEVIQRSKLISDNVKWFLAKLRRQRFGEAIDVTSNGETLAAVAVPGTVPLGSPLDAADLPQQQPPKRKGKA